MKLIYNKYVIKKNGNEYDGEEPAVMAMDILFYADSRGRQPVLEWYVNLEKREPETFRKVYYQLLKLSENGNCIRSREIKPKNIKKLKGTDDIWQLRIDENRVLFFYYGKESIVITNQFKKKKNETPKREISRAESRKKYWLNQNN